MRSTFQLLTTLVLCCMLCTKTQAQKKQDNPIYIDKQGVLRYTIDNKEASFWGVNYTAPFAYAYRAIKAVGRDVKQVMDDDVYHFARLGLDAFRVHVWDVEITDSLGNLLENEHLQLFDYLIAQLKKRNIKIIVTPIAYWGNGYPERDEKTIGFSSVYGKGQANVNEKSIKAQENYLAQFFKHVNSYTGLSYTNDPDIIATEINNEPSHSGSKPSVTNYINRMNTAIENAGWTKPIFYNISQNPYYADAVAASDVDGYSFQWYPIGLVANHEIKGNFLPHVNRYTIPFDTIVAYRNKPKMVYEFDAADILQSSMYPAIAKSFKSAGFQWVTQFAYDPIAIAYGNTEYQTHYLNLAYTPSKAISLMIAGKAFHKLERNKTSSGFPADTTFDVFRVSYKNDLSEMNSEEQFLYSNSTETKPANVRALKHVAGVGSSSVVKYEGTGAYFLDRIEEGVWRLEVMPDAIHIRDPFERASPKKEVTRIQWNIQPMQITLADLGHEFVVEPLNEKNTYRTETANSSFTIFPGTYLVRAKNKTLKNRNAKIERIGLNEFAAPATSTAEPFLVYEPVSEICSGKNFTVHAKATGLDTSYKLILQVTGRQFRNINFKRITAYDYAAEIPADVLVPGIINYRILINRGNDYYVYPGNVKGNPYAWDNYNNDYYKLIVADSDRDLVIFNPATDERITTYPSFRRGFETRVIPSASGNTTLQFSGSFTNADQSLGFQYFIGDKISGRISELNSFTKLIVRARAVDVTSIKANISLITKDAFAFSTVAELTNKFQEIEISLSQLQSDSSLLLPRPYPDFMPLWFKATGNADLKAEDAEKVEVTVRAKSQNINLNTPFKIQIESIRFSK
jgi:hypothetical protein